METVHSLPVLLDGATGTELQKRGMPRGVCTERWILEHRSELLDLQRAYVEAGAAVLTAPTFGVTDRVEEDYRALVALSRAVAGGCAMVAGDLGPGGEMERRAAALKAAGVDLYLVETMVSLEEAKAAVTALRERDPGKLILVSFYPHSGLDDTAALAAMEELAVDAFGFNCAAPGVILEHLKRLAPHTNIPLLAMPGFETPVPSDTLARYAERFAALGVRYFGGCCGTTPEAIAKMREKLGETQRRM